MVKKVKFGISGDVTQDELNSDYETYDGDLPPGGVFPVRVKNIALKKNKNGDYMLFAVAEFNAPNGHRHEQFNGFALFVNQNITAQGAKWINNCCDALGWDRKAFWDGPVLDGDDSDDRRPIIKVGTHKILAEYPATVQVKRGRYEGQPKVEWVQFVGIGKESPNGKAKAKAVEADDEADEDEPTPVTRPVAVPDPPAEDEEVEPYTAQELEDLTIIELSAVLTEEFEIEITNDLKSKVGRTMKLDKDKLVAAILTAQDESDEDSTAPF